MSVELVERMGRITGIVLLIMVWLGSMYEVKTQPTKHMNGRTFVKQGDTWYQKVENKGKIKVYEKQITIKFKDDISKSQITDFISQQNLTFENKTYLGYYDFLLSDEHHPVPVVSKLVDHSYIQSVETILTYNDKYGSSPSEPNDTHFSKQWHLQDSTNDINYLKAKDLAKEGGAVIANYDMGLQLSHEDIGKGLDDYGNIWKNPAEDAWDDPTDPSTGNGVDDDNNGKVDDWRGWNFDADTNDVTNDEGNSHGTLTAGVAVAKTHNSTGVAGVAGGYNNRGAVVMPLKDEPGEFDDAVCYAAKEGADVLTVQQTVSVNRDANEAALADAYNNHDLFMVASTGNADSDDSIWYPAVDTTVLAIGATVPNNNRWSESDGDGSNWVKDSNAVDLVAPGFDIYTTDISSEYAYVKGTSFSAPMVAGAAALIRSINSNISNSAIEHILENTADTVGDYTYGSDSYHREVGHGRLDLYGAVQYTLEHYGGKVGGYVDGVGSSFEDLTLHRALTITDSVTVSTKQGTHLSIDDGVGIKVYGKLSIGPDARVGMGKDSRINVWGQMITEGKEFDGPVYFLPGPNGWNDKIKFRKGSSGNRFDYTVISGGNKSLEINSTNNTLYKTRIKNGWRGISGGSASSGNASVTLKHVIVEGNSSVGIVAYYTNPKMEHVTVRYNDQAGIWFYESDTDVFYKSLVDSNAIGDDTRAGIESRVNSEVTLYGQDGSDDKAYSRIMDNVKDEIWLKDFSAFSLGLNCCGYRIGGYNSIHPNSNAFELEAYDVENDHSEDAYAEYVYWGDPNETEGSPLVTSNVVTDNQLTDSIDVDEGASGVPGSSVDPSGSGAKVVYPSLTTTSSSSEGKRNATQNSDVKLLAEADDPFALAKKGGAAVGVEEKLLPVAKAQAIADRMQQLREVVVDDTTSNPSRWLQELFTLQIIDERNQSEEHEANMDLFENISDKLVSSSSLSSADQKAAEKAALMRVHELTKMGKLAKANGIIEEYVPEVDSSTKRNLLMQRVAVYTGQGDYAKAQDALEKVKELEGTDAYHPTLEQILADKKKSKSAKDRETVSAEQESPDQLTLKPAYPNPFNPTTTIRYNLPTKTKVTLNVYNIMGRRVATLVDSQQEAGRHAVTFDGAGLASGVYLYRITTSKYTRIRKMLLLK